MWSALEAKSFASAIECMCFGEERHGYGSCPFLIMGGNLYGLKHVTAFVLSCFVLLLENDSQCRLAAFGACSQIFEKMHASPINHSL